MKHINENHHLHIAGEFVETVGKFLCKKLEEEAFGIHFRIHEIYQQILAFFYRSIFVILYDDIRFSESEHIWKNLTQRMDAIPMDGYLWEKDTCSLFTEFSICNEDILLELSNLENMILEMTVNSVGFLHQRLLEKIPIWESGRFLLQSKYLNDRKKTGTFYTPNYIVDIVLQRTLEEYLRCITTVDGVLGVRICDPSCGTGNFLLRATEVLCDKISNIKQNDNKYKDFSREDIVMKVVESCIYGVDLHPLSSALCQISLWIKVRKQENSLSFLRRISKRNIKFGNSLLGVTKEQILGGIKNQYFDLIKDLDERKIRKQIVKKNRTTFMQQQSIKHLSLPTTTDKEIADLLLASMLWPKISEGEWLKCSPYNSLFTEIRNKKSIIPEEMKCHVDKLEQKHHFFHWHLEFEDIFSEGGFDIVIGNPPYIDSEFLKKHAPRERTAIGHLYESARGNWDLFIPFTELAIRITKENGLQSFVTPNKILGADYAKALQKKFFSYSIQEVHDFSPLGNALFDGASVSVVAVIITKYKAHMEHCTSFFQYHSIHEKPSKISSLQEQLQKLPSGYISFPITSTKPQLLEWLEQPYTIADFATVSDGLTTGEAYIIRDLVVLGKREDLDDDSQIKLINTGTIDPYKNLWGERAIRYLGFQGEYPVIQASLLKKNLPKRYMQSEHVKIVVAGMASRIEAVVVPSGFLCGKSAVQIIPKVGVCPYALAGFLNGRDVTVLYKGLFSMRGMGGDSMNIGPRQIEKMPVPKHFGKEHTSNSCEMLSSYSKSLHTSLSFKRENELLEKVDEIIEKMMNETSF